MKNLSFKNKIMFSIIGMLFLLSTFVAVYFPSTEEKILNDIYSKIVTNTTESLTLGMELSLNSGDLTNVDKIFNFAKKDQRIKYIVILSEGEVFVSYPKDLKFDKKTLNKKDGIIVRQNEIKTSLLNGTVVVGMSTETIDTIIKESYIVALAIGLISLIFGGIIAIFISKSVAKPIIVAKIAAEKISKGDLNVNLDNTFTDEIGDLLNSMNLMVKNIQNVSVETNNMINNVESGNLLYRCTETEFEGSWKENLVGINSIVDKIVKPLNVTSSYIDMMSKGLIPKTINEEYKGDFNLIKENINELILVQSKVTEFANAISDGNLNAVLNPRSSDDILVIGMNSVKSKILSLVDSIEIMSGGLSVGKLYSRLETNQLNGSYKDLANNFNDALDVLVNFFNINSNIMIADSKRDITFINNPLTALIANHESYFRSIDATFNTNKVIGQKIDNFLQLSNNNRNELLNLSTEFNTIISVDDKKIKIEINPIKDRNGKVLAYIINWNDITDQVVFNLGLENLSDELINGNLKYRLNVNEQLGEYVDLSKSINLMVNNVVQPLLLTSDYLDKISKGVIPEIINKDYKGDFEIIKSNINKLIITMNLLISEMQTMKNEHDSGDLDFAANENNFEGVFRKVIYGLNELVFSHVDTKKKVVNVFNEFANGNFKSDLAKLPGKKAFLNVAIDNIRNNFVNFNREISELADAAQRGELSFRADKGAFKGDWELMVTSLNELLDKIVNPINDAGEVLSFLAEGDMTARINNNYGGDFEKLKNNINHLSESLNQVLTKVSESVQNTATTTHELSASAETMAAAAQEQSAQTDDVASAVEQMSRTITANANSARNTAEVAERNGQIAITGGKAVEDTVSKMKDIAKVVRNTSTSIEKLGASSQEIGEIISVIDDIADQTNLLALNAAIEAARAGEQGRGFAVVADEVRKLAERTSDATKEIAKMIKGIQQETQDAVIVMQTGTKEVEYGIRLADDAGNSLKLIVNSSQELINMITQISAASEEQSASSEEISKNVISISEVISDSAKQIEEIAEASENLSKQTMLLSELMQQFKLDKIGSYNNFSGKYLTN